MNDLIIPNWHPLLVHFTIALIVTSSVFFILSRVSKKQAKTFTNVGKWTLWTAAIVTIFTVLAGFAAYSSVAHDDIAHEVMKVHRLWALVTAMAILLVAFWVYKAKAVTGAIVGASLVLTGLVGVTGFFGSELVYRHGLGVMRLPDTSGEGHDHGGNASHSHGSNHQEETSGHDVGHDHATPEAGHDQHAPASTTVIEGHSHAGMSAQDYARHFQDALYSGNFDSVANSFAKDAVIFENGVREVSLESYLERHLKPEMPMLKAAERKLLKQDVRHVGDLAMVTTAATLSLKSKGKQHDFYSVETLGLLRMDGEWKVVHVHWSSRPIKRQQ